MKVLRLLFLMLSCGVLSAKGQVLQDTTGKMQWFADAKLGIFIHWGIYAVDGVDESWSFHNRKISYEKYLEQLSGFTASNYDPADWASLIRESGARYAVITAKHHDGVALWDTHPGLALPGRRGKRRMPVVPWLSVPARTPAARDVLSPLTRALRNQQIKVGIYYSLIDWSYPDYPGFLKDSTRYSIQEDPGRWQRFLHYNQEQLIELMNEQDPDLWWFDGDWEHSAEEWRAAEIRSWLLNHRAGVIINGRLAGQGDYGTPEQNFPVVRPDETYWELCLTTNDNWGFQPTDTNWKTPAQLLSIFTDVIGNGGNLLLDIGPKADGTIPEQQRFLLTEMGRWIRGNEEAVYGTRGGIPPGHFYGASTMSADSTVLYFFLPENLHGEVSLKGLRNPIVSAEMLDTRSPVPFKVIGKLSWSPKPGMVFFDIPAFEGSQPVYFRTLRVQLDGPVRLYRGE